MDAKVTWDHGMTFAGTANSGFTVPLGTSPKVGGDDDGFKPMELMAISLGGCTAMDVISILRKKRQDITAYEVSVNTKNAETHPSHFILPPLKTENRNAPPGPMPTAMASNPNLQERVCPLQRYSEYTVGVEQARREMQAEGTIRPERTRNPLSSFSSDSAAGTLQWPRRVRRSPPASGRSLRPPGPRLLSGPLHPDSL